jgi:hypothetical protein
MAKGIFCLESDWIFNSSLELLSKTTIEPMLEFLNKHEKIQYVYRKVATRTELSFCLNQLKKTENAFQIVYLSFHGRSQKVYLAGEPKKNSAVTLDELATLAKGAFKNKYIHFSSCETFIGTEDIFEKFKKKTGALNVSGYTTEVNYTLSAILDIAWFNELNKVRTSVDKANKSFLNKYNGLVDELGFKIY